MNFTGKDGSATPVRWGLVGTGHMASVLAAEFAALPATEARLLAIAGRNAQRMAALAATHGIARAYNDIEALARDPDIDALYIATPHTLHHTCMLAAIEAGKAVLCEKPFTLNARQAAEVIAMARRRGTFVMEAMWTRFLPAVAALRAMVTAGTIGRIRLIVGGGAFMPDRHGGHYLFDPQRGGGALLDAGVYLVSLSCLLLGSPVQIHAVGELGASDVDEQDAMLLQHSSGALSCLYLSLHARRSPDLEILGEAGRIRIAAPVFRPTRLHLWSQDCVEQQLDYPIEGSGYGYQVRAVNQALRTGQTESPLMPLAETLAVMQTLDAIRERIGLIYPAETATN